MIRAFASENLESLLHDLHHIHQSATLAYDAHHRLAMPMLVAPVKMTEPIDLTATLVIIKKERAKRCRRGVS